MTTDPAVPVVIVGAGEFAEIAYEYFTDYSAYQVAAFAVEKAYLTQTVLYGLPVVPFEDIPHRYPPHDYKVFVAITYTQLNRVRRRLFQTARSLGYDFVSFVHPTVFLGRDVSIGSNVFIFEDNNIQRRVRIGDNTIIWSKNHIGHLTVIKDHCYLASGVIISGYCAVGACSFLGVNSSFNDRVTVADDTLVGNGAIVTKTIEMPGGVYVGNPATRLQRDSYSAFGVKEEEK